MGRGIDPVARRQCLSTDRQSAVMGRRAATLEIDAGRDASGQILVVARLLGCRNGRVFEPVRAPQQAYAPRLIPVAGELAVGVEATIGSPGLDDGALNARRLDLIPVDRPLPTGDVDPVLGQSVTGWAPIRAARVRKASPSHPSRPSHPAAARMKQISATSSSIRSITSLPGCPDCGR